MATEEPGSISRITPPTATPWPKMSTFLSPEFEYITLYSKGGIKEADGVEVVNQLALK